MTSSSKSSSIVIEAAKIIWKISPHFYATHSPTDQSSIDGLNSDDNLTAKSTASPLGPQSKLPSASSLSSSVPSNNDDLPIGSHLSYVFAGIFDGHSGEQAEEFTRRVLLSNITSAKDFWSGQDDLILKSVKDGFSATHQAMLHEVDKWPSAYPDQPSTSGTTASVCFIMNNKIHTGHVGDTRIISCRSDEKTGLWVTHTLTHDHRPESPEEKERINEAGGEISKDHQGNDRVVWFRT